MKMKFLGLMMLAALFTTAGAVAQEKEKVREGKGNGEMFAKLDTDNDGKISLAEADKAPKGKLKENFAAIDTNKDSYLDKDELKAYREQKRKERQGKGRK
ncbi:EF-hand domain-containing protein [Flavobacterium sp.]|uniref:EF-hand domain-containing protein n=1 Tax=Flavobacterium sp. TaxID=239 RepID=UPI004033FF09